MRGKKPLDNNNNYNYYGDNTPSGEPDGQSPMTPPSAPYQPPSAPYQPTTTPAPVPAPARKGGGVKEVWLNIGIVVLTLIIAFTGAFCGIYYVCHTALFGESEFMTNFLAKYAGIEEHRVEVDSISGQYTGDRIELAQKVLNTTVCIRVVTNVDGVYTSSVSGSGIIFDYNEETGRTLIVTNHHVVYGSEKFYVDTYNGKRYDGKVLHLDEICDLALVEIYSDDKLTEAVIADSTKAVAGQDIVAAGNPRGLGFSVSFGYVSHPDRDNGDIGGNLIQMDISVNPGNSGGGVYDAQGNLLGVVVSKEVGDNVDGIGYAIPSARMMKVIDELLTFGYVKGRAALGISAYTVTASNYTSLANGELAGYLPLTGARKYGLYVENSTRSTEIKKGDRIVSADGILLSTIYDLRNVIAKHPPFSTIDLTVERLVGTDSEGNPNYEKFDVKVLLGERDWPDEVN